MHHFASDVPVVWKPFTWTRSNLEREFIRYPIPESDFFYTHSSPANIRATIQYTVYAGICGISQSKLRTLGNSKSEA